MEVEGEENKDYLLLNQISGMDQYSYSQPGSYKRHYKIWNM